MITYNVALDQFELLILILMRMASFVFAAPFFNTANTPQRLKVGLSFFLSFLVYTLHPDMNVEYNGLIEYAGLIVMEVMVGILLGAMASFCVQIIHFAGKLIDMDIGISMAQIMDPTTKVQVGIMGNFYYYMLMLLLIISGLHQYLVAAIIETYNVIPIGGINKNKLIHNQAPVMNRLNMFVVGMQLKIFVGIFVIFFTIVMLPSVSTFIYNEIQTIMASLVRGMS